MGVVQQAPSAFDPKAADVITDRASKPGSERACEIDGVQPDSAGELTQSLWTRLIVQQVTRSREPAAAGIRLANRCPGRFSEQLADEPLDGQWGDIVPPHQLGTQPSSMSCDLRRALHKHVDERRNRISQGCQRVGPQLDDEALHWSRPKAIRVHGAGWFRDERRRTVGLNSASPHRFLIFPFQDDVQGCLFVRVRVQVESGREPHRRHGVGPREYGEFWSPAQNARDYSSHSHGFVLHPLP